MDLTKSSTTITGVLLVVVVALAPTSTAQPIPIPVPITQATSYFDAVELHFDRLIHYSLDRYGATRSGLWVSSIDIHTNELIQLPSVAAEESDRHFVRGAHLYWDQPMLVAAEAIAEQSGCKCYSDSVDSYLRSYLHLTAHDGKFVVAPNSYYDVWLEQLRPLTPIKRRAMLHTPAWELLHQRDPAATRKTMQSWMRIDQEHPTAADTVAAINSLWAAVAILEFNIDNHEEQLLQLSQSHWDRRKPHDRHAPRESMDQAFAFADACMRAFDLTKNERLKTLATTYVQSWVTQISDSAAGEGRPTEAISPDDASLSNLPTVAGESCLTLWTATHDQDYQQVVERIAEVIEHSVGSPNNKYNTAEDYGRVIHFLNRASEVLEKPNYRDMAILVADEAMEKLHVRETGMFRSRVGVDRCDATDGPGWLLLALLSLDGDDPTESSSLRF